MQFTLTTAFLTLASALLASAQVPTTINYDDRYCRAAERSSTVACSGGENGIENRWPTFGQVPQFPQIGGGFPVAGFNDTDCGSCWQVSYAGTGRSVPITLINAAPSGFTLCTDTLLALTGFDRDNVPDNIPVTVVQVAASECGQ